MHDRCLWFWRKGCLSVSGELRVRVRKEVERESYRSKIGNHGDPLNKSSASGRPPLRCARILGTSAFADHVSSVVIAHFPLVPRYTRCCISEFSIFIIYHYCYLYIELGVSRQKINS